MKYLLFLLSFSVYAGDYQPIVNKYVTETIINQNDCSGDAENAAMNQVHPEVSSSKLQLGIGIGRSQGCDAIGFGIAKQVDKNVLLNGSASGDSWGIGINAKF